MFELWYDVETTGLKPKKAGIVQLAAILVKDNTIVDTFNQSINPETYNRDVEITEEALKINKLTNYKEFKSAELVMKEFLHFLTVNCPKDKVKLFGYNNSTFDKFFLESYFKDQGKDISTYIYWKQIDIFELVKALQYMKVIPKSFNQKLATVAKSLDIEVREDKLHNALYDVDLTRGIYLKIKEKIKNGNN